MKTLYDVMDALKHSIDDLQATESHCINVKHRNLTDYELDCWKQDKKRCASALIEAIAKLTAELAELHHDL